VVNELKVLKKIDDIAGRISKIFLYISAVAMFVMAFICFCDVIGRYFLNKPITGAQEVVQIAMAVFVFFGIGQAARNERLTKVPLFVDKMGPVMHNYVKAFASIAGVLTSILFCRQLMLTAISYSGGTIVKTATLGVPYWPLYGIASIGCGLMALELLMRAIREICAGTAALKMRTDENEDHKCEEQKGEDKP